MSQSTSAPEKPEIAGPPPAAGEGGVAIQGGAAILAPAFVAGVAPGASSMSPLFDRAVEAGRICGLRLEGVWMHVGTPEAVTAAEAAIVASAA